MDVGYLSGEAYEIQVRGHKLRVDQPVADGGADSGPTPTELLVASLAGCVAYYAGRYLDRHGLSRDGLRVTADYDMATERPARVTAVRVAVRAPDCPPARRPGLLAVASHCTVHNTLVAGPQVEVELTE